MNSTRHQRRNAAAATRRNQWADYTGPVHRPGDLAIGQARVNRPALPASPVE